MRRIVLGALIGAAAAIVVCAVMLLTPVHVNDGRNCGSVAIPKSPDPTAEEEHGCGDVRQDRGGYTILFAMIGAPLAIGVGAATAASTLAFAR